MEGQTAVVNYFLVLTPLICQDTSLGGSRDGSARAEVCHDALVDLAGKEAFTLCERRRSSGNEKELA